MSPYSTALFKSKKHFIEYSSVKGVFYEPCSQAYAEQIASFLPKALNKVENLHGVPFKKPVEIYVCNSQKSLNEYIAHDSRAPIRGTVVLGDILISPSAFKWKGKDTHQETLLHELSHLHIRQNLGFVRSRKNIPVWFHEGLANLAEGSGGEGITDEEAIRLILVGYHFIPDNKGNIFRSKRTYDYGLDYPMFHKQTKLFVSYIGESRSTEFKNFLKDILKGKPFKEALATHMGSDVQSLWEDFVSHLEKQSSAL